MKEILSGIYSWSRFSAKKGYNFNGFFLEEDALLIDPPEADDRVMKKLEDLGPPSAVLVTNQHHLRSAPGIAAHFGAKLFMPEAEAERVESPVDVSFKPGDDLPWSAEVISMPGKTPGEIGLYLFGSSTLILGDAIIGHPPGQLSLLPEPVLQDPDKLHASVRNLLDYDFDVLLVGDGEHILRGARDAVVRLVESWGPS